MLRQVSGQGSWMHMHMHIRRVWSTFFDRRRVGAHFSTIVLPFFVSFLLAILGRSWGDLGPVLARSWGGLEAVLGRSWGRTASFSGSTRSVSCCSCCFGCLGRLGLKVDRCSRSWACFVELKRRFPFSAAQVSGLPGVGFGRKLEEIKLKPSRTFLSSPEP